MTDTAKCECCGLTEECTPEYIAGVRARHHGRWICGLCAEAVKDEISRSGERISTEEALDRHATFRSSPPPPNSSACFISAVSHLLRKSFRSSPDLRSVPSSPRNDRDGRPSIPILARSESCFSSLAG